MRKPGLDSWIFACALWTSIGLAWAQPETRYAGVVGWDGDHDAAIAFEDGSFRIRDGRDLNISFGITDGHQSLKWFNRAGYLPSLVTEFQPLNGLQISVENFGDRVGSVMAVYSRVSVTNLTRMDRMVDPKASGGLIALGPSSALVEPGETHKFDYVIAADRFGNRVAEWPSDDDLRAAGGFDAHFAHMRAYWDAKLSRIARIHTPDPRLDDAYRASFITTHILKDGTELRVGENGYDRVYDHDAVGIMANLLTQGYLEDDAQDLMLAVPVYNFFEDATWKHSWPWALYLLKTGDVATVLTRWKTIRDAVHSIAAARTGPGGIIKATHAIDTEGFWTVDNWSALTGLWAYRYLATRVGQVEEAAWADAEYEGLLSAVNTTLDQTMRRSAVPYIPAAMLEPNSANRCADPTDANWAAHLLFGRWSWDGWLMGAPQRGVSLDGIDATYEAGLAKLRSAGLPEGTFGGYPGYSSGYNAGYGAGALRGERYRSIGIHAYQFMIENTQSSPYGWWEGIYRPADSHWEGVHPSYGDGSSPHSWGYAVNNKVLLESIAAEFFDGTWLAGRGVPDEWLVPGKPPVSVEHFALSGGHRAALRMQAVSAEELVLQATSEGEASLPAIRWDLPLFAAHPAVEAHSDQGSVEIAENGKSVRAFPAGARSIEIRVHVRR